MISPESSTWSPARTRIRVDLPAPFSPTRAWISPRRTLKLTLSTATVGPNALVTSRKTRTGSSVCSSKASAGSEIDFMRFGSNPVEIRLFLLGLLPHLHISGFEIEADVVLLSWGRHVGAVGELNRKVLVHSDLRLVQTPVSLIDTGPGHPLEPPADSRSLRTTLADLLIGDRFSVEARPLDLCTVALLCCLEKRRQHLVEGSYHPIEGSLGQPRQECLHLGDLTLCTLRQRVILLVDHFGFSAAKFINVFLHAIQAHGQLCKLRSVENDNAATAIGHDESPEELTGRRVIEPISHIATIVAGIVREAGDKGHPLFLSAGNLVFDIA